MPTAIDRAEQQAAAGDEQPTRPTRSRRAGALRAPSARGDRERAPALLEAEAEREAGRGDGEHAARSRARPWSARTARPRSGWSRRPGAGRRCRSPARRCPTPARTRCGDGGRARCRRSARGTRRPRRCRSPWRRSAALATRNESRRRGRELLGHADVVERDRRELLGAAVLQAQAQQVARAAAGSPCTVSAETSTPSGAGAERAHQLRGACRPANQRVLQLAGRADRLRAHAVEVLQVGADVGEAVLQRLDAARRRRPAPARGRACGPDAARRATR